MRLRPHGSRAFTLVELLAVVAIIAVVTGFSVPAMQTLNGGGNLSQSANKFADLLGLARSEAIARHTVVRFAVARDWQGKPDNNLRKYSLWAWDVEVQRFLQIGDWQDLPAGITLDPTNADYLKSSKYWQQDKASLRGDLVLSEDFQPSAEFIDGPGGERVTMRYVEFLPSGTVRLPGGEKRNAIFVATLGQPNEDGTDLRYTQASGTPNNWAQINVDLLTGRARIYQP